MTTTLLLVIIAGLSLAGGLVLVGVTARRHTATGRTSAALQVLLARRIAAMPQSRLAWIERPCSTEAAVRSTAAPTSAPTAALTVSLADMIRMATGAVAVPTLLQEGRLCLIGDVTVIMRFPALFRLPTRALV